VAGLEVGEVSAPVRVGEQLYVVSLIERDESQLPSYEEAQMELQNRVYLQKMDQARRRWLDQLRNRTHVEIRL
jgi:peptidyl-prolyl cis-trans isomerase SurA